MTHRSSWARRVQPGSGRIGGNQTERSENDRVEGIVTMMDDDASAPVLFGIGVAAADIKREGKDD